MRTLKFDVDCLLITQSEGCDFDNLISGTEGYLQAEFSFSKEWDGFVKAAEFDIGAGRKVAVILEDGTTCMIPSEATKRRAFGVRVVGKKGDDQRLVTCKIVVVQNGGI